MTDDDTNTDDADDAVSLGQCEETECTDEAVYKLHRCTVGLLSGETTHIECHLCCEEHYEVLQQWADQKEHRALEIFAEVGADA